MYIVCSGANSSPASSPQVAEAFAGTHCGVASGRTAWGSAVARSAANNLGEVMSHDSADDARSTIERRTFLQLAGGVALASAAQCAVSRRGGAFEAVRARCEHDRVRQDVRRERHAVRARHRGHRRGGVSHLHALLGAAEVHRRRRRHARVAGGRRSVLSDAAREAQACRDRARRARRQDDRVQRRHADDDESLHRGSASAETRRRARPVPDAADRHDRHRRRVGLGEEPGGLDRSAARDRRRRESARDHPPDRRQVLRAAARVRHEDRRRGAADRRLQDDHRGLQRDGACIARVHEASRRDPAGRRREHASRDPERLVRRHRQRLVELRDGEDRRRDRRRARREERGEGRRPVGRRLARAASHRHELREGLSPAQRLQALHVDARLDSRSVPARAAAALADRAGRRAARRV